MADEKDPNTDDPEANASVEDSSAEDTPAEEAAAEDASGGEGAAKYILAEIPEGDQDAFGGDKDRGDGTHTARDLSAVYDVPVQVSAVLGKATMPVSQLLKLGRGAVVELDRKVGEAIDIYVNNRLVARGEIVVVDERLGVTMTEIVKSDR